MSTEHPWIPVTERLPVKGLRVEVTGNGFREIATYDRVTWAGVTHWRLLQRGPDGRLPPGQVVGP